MTQRELGEKLGIAYQTVAQWENGLRNPKYETLKKIADALQTTPAALMGDNPPDPMVEFSDSSKHLYVELSACTDEKLIKYAVDVVKSLNQVFTLYQEIDSRLSFMPEDTGQMEYNYIDIMNYCATISKFVSDINVSSYKMLQFIQEMTTAQSLKHWKKRNQTNNPPADTSSPLFDSSEAVSSDATTNDTEV